MSLRTVAGDECPSCGASLAPDQRYCLRCGQRRGSAGLPLATTSAEPSVPVAVPKRGHNTVNTTLIAGVGTLLLAMGVGVIIGRASQKTAPAVAAGRVSVVTVAG